MKSIYKLLLVVTGVAMFGTAVAGEQYRYDGASIYARDYSYNSSFIDADSYCNEYPDGMGGTYVNGYTRIYGYINGSFVNHYESYNGLDSCPQADNFGQSKKQDFEISLNGVTVSADCSEQATSHSSGNGQSKNPGQKPQNYTTTYSQHWTANPYDITSCVITATNADGDVDDTFDYYQYARQNEQFRNYN